VNFQTNNLVIVTWQDAQSTSCLEGETCKLALNINVGYPGKHSKDCYVLVNGISNTGENDVLCIPVNNVVKVESVFNVDTKKRSKSNFKNN